MTPRSPPAPMSLSVAVAMLAGVSACQVLPALPPLWLGAVLSVIAAGFYIFAPTWRDLAALVFGLCWAALVGQSVMQQRLPDSRVPMTVLVEGRVLGLPQREPDSVRFDFRIERGPAGVPVGEKVRLGWYGQPPGLDPGSCWRLLVRLKCPQGVLNPGGYDFEKSALAQRLAATGYVRDPASARRLAPAQGVDAWRDRVSHQIAQALPAGRARFVQALALGDTRALSDRDWEILRATGLTHQIAISGFHVGMVAGFGALLASGLFWLWPELGRRVPRPQATAVGALAFAAAYTALAGFALPTVRTLLMIAAVLMAKLLRRPQSGADAFALAMIVVLLVDPLSVLAPGFWLSFLGVAWLLWCLPHERQAGVLRPFFESQGVAVLGLLPLTVWFFGQASLPGPLANLLGIPAISLVIVPLALLGLLVAPMSAGLAGLFWTGSAWVMDGLWWCLERMAHWPAATIWLPEASLLAVVLGCLAAFWLLLPRGTPGKALALFLFLPLLWPDRHTPAPGEAEIVVIDVGQGLSVLVRTAAHTLLFDAGPANARGLDMGEAAVLPGLHALGIGRLDTIVISHGDNDHAGGLTAVQRAFPLARVLAPEGWAGPGMHRCQRDAHWRWDGVDFRILHPPPLFPYERNDSSCVLRIEAGGRVALIPGDIGRHVETRLVREQAPRLWADLLIAPHHGSDGSSSEAFVAAVNPRWVIFATGASNRFGLPRANIAERYRRRGAAIADTARTGMLRFSLDEQGVRRQSARRTDTPRYWREPGATGSGYAIGSPDSER
ncbi:DNA internalization-related competence protein ComEC/Rec2 [Arenimonas oryziterrae]|nr:DNA internalization-related competence protein ComEC/Rec2 [Arenimonas oryziterrae]